jgi:UDP-N-acetyl-2-amino-2-deoxyglucuronate dehydrogenase
VKNFAITGVAGYVAPRHLRAIRDTGNRLVAATDPHDSVGILDGFFDEVSYFREFERFDRHVEKLRRRGDEHRVHYLSICSPNYLHDAHIRFALRVGSDAICEKPLVLNPWNLDALAELEPETGRKVNTILQLRLHPAMRLLRESLAAGGGKRKKNVVLTYVTSRGSWYLHSWKGSKEKSGGLSTNIGIHFFDLLIWIFGAVERSKVHLSEPTKEAGHLELKNAHVRWFLSIDPADLPFAAEPGKQSTYRSLEVDGHEIEFSGGFADLHTESYREVFKGNGFGIEDARVSIETVYNIRNAKIVKPGDMVHPLVAGRPLSARRENGMTVKRK